jgi:hypothetical protein
MENAQKVYLHLKQFITFTSSEYGVTGLDLPSHSKQREYQAKYMEQGIQTLDNCHQSPVVLGRGGANTVSPKLIPAHCLKAASGCRDLDLHRASEPDRGQGGGGGDGGEGDAERKRKRESPFKILADMNPLK